MGSDDMDSYVFCLAQKKTAIKVSKEMSDIMTFCPEKKPAQDRYGLPSNSSYYIMSEIPEVTSAMLTDSKLMAMLNKYPDSIDSIHFSDQYTVSENCSLMVIGQPLFNLETFQKISVKADYRTCGPISRPLISRPLLKRC